MILQGHQTLAIQPTGNLYCHDSVYIELNGASIQNRGTMLFGSAHALRGTGTIEGNGELAWNRSIRTEWNDSLTFRNGMTFSTQCLPDSTNTWENYGVISFEGTTPYRFERCIDSLFNGGGRWQLGDSVVFENTPHFVNWSGALLEVNGTDSTCHMQFAPYRNLDNYGHLYARNTVFEGTSRDTSDAWNGILSALDDAVLVLDDCRIRDIRTVDDGGGSAIHLYESDSPENIVRNTYIERPLTYNPEGDGIFLQGLGISSSLEVLCSDIRSRWWSGITNVNSYLHLTTSRVFANRIGVGYVSSVSSGSITKNCIEEQLDAGLHMNYSAARFGYPLIGVNGENRIVNNDTTQIDLRNESYLLGGSLAGSCHGENNIDHPDQSKRRIVLDSTSTAELTDNWWGDAVENGGTYTLSADMQQRYISSPWAGNVHFDPVKGAEINLPPLPECVDTSILFPKAGALPPFASSLWELPRYSRANNFAEVYRFIGHLLTHNPTPAQASRTCSFLLFLEAEHARRYPDSTQMCLSRSTAFYGAMLGVISHAAVRADILSSWARALLVFGNPTQAGAKAQQLRSSYPGSNAAREILPVLQMVAMAERDSSAIVSIINDMRAAGYSDLALHQAYGMKRGFDRVLPRWRFPKKVSDAAQGNRPFNPADGLTLSNHPNPFNPSTMVEFRLPRETHASVRVYNLLGQSVSSLLDADLPAGAHRVEYTVPSGLPSGMYLMMLTTEYGVKTSVMMLAK
ncbi:MAG: T9SS type A sorting domain-containing protein [Ignavibacteria bacterium]|nr:T9SS type A sorting domain-containing protein [Ignavibacteria bacterium]